MKYITALFFAFSLLSITKSASLAQVNSSQEANYKTKTSMSFNYSTQYDNGYVVLKDGTQLTGQIALVGQSYNNLWGVKIKTSSGNKYSLQMRSLKEFGLASGLTNDTPEFFSWTLPEKKSVINGFKSIRIGYADFGYVTDKSGKTYDGSIQIKEVSGKIENISIRDASKNLTKLDAEDISNFGVKKYKDPKFEGAWSIIRWKQNSYTSTFANTKSIPYPGYVNLTNGQKVIGDITLLRKGTQVNKVNVLGSADAKPQKIKTEDIKSYGYTIKMADINELYSKYDVASINPNYRFFPGKITMEDGTIKQGFVAKSSANDLSDAYFSKDENSYLELIDQDQIDEVDQEIPDEEWLRYKNYIYNQTHVEGYKIQNPNQWKYDGKYDPNIYKTLYQPGYVRLKNGDTKVGSISINKQGTITKVRFKESGKDLVKYGYKDYETYGLLEQEAKTAFPAELFSKSNKGFIRLFNTDETLYGDLKIKTKNNKAGSSELEKQLFIFNHNGTEEEYKESNIDIYGLVDVDIQRLQKATKTADPKQGFHPGSFVLDGIKKEGVIAWAAPNDGGQYFAFYYATAMDGPANVFYLSSGVSDIVQNIEIIDLETQSKSEELANTGEGLEGYVITHDGEKMEGEIALTIPPKIQFATNVQLKKADGEVRNYANDNSLREIIITEPGREALFVSFEGEYVEVLQQDGHWVHFKNPHPTTLSTLSSFGNDILNQSAQDGLESLDRRADEEAMKDAMKKSIEGDWDEGDQRKFNDFMSRKRMKWTDTEFLKFYKKEYVVMNKNDGTNAIYIPSFTEPSSFFRIEGLLMGCIEFLELEPSEQKQLFKMKNPQATLSFLNQNLTN